MISQTVTKTETIEKNILKIQNNEDPFAETKNPYKREIVYRNLVTFGYWHLAALFGIYLGFTSAKWATIFLTFFLYTVAEIGLTAGSHRLWSHKTYKAKVPLEILLMVMNSIAFQNTVTDWVRDHRLHHKHSDTDADPHNSTRGLFYSHVGWMLVRKHPEVKEKGKVIEMSDIYSNPVLKFQRKYAIPWMTTIAFILPTVIPIYFWGETFKNAWHLNMLRFVMNMNATLLINSVAHRWGYRPYDSTILPTDNERVSIFTFGEGYHNYHHVFPWDYRTGELGLHHLNLTTMFIDFFARIGWAYDLKTAPNDMIRARANRTGVKMNENVWGWDDEDFSDTIKNKAEIIFRKNEN